MSHGEHRRPAQLRSFAEPMQGELKNIFATLVKCDLGPFRFVYSDADGALYLQCMDKEGKLYRTVQKWSRPGDDTGHTGSGVEIRGVVDSEKWGTLESPGNG